MYRSKPNARLTQTPLHQSRDSKYSLSMTERNVGMEVKVRDQFVLTVFNKRVREFGMTSEEVDQYITLLRTAQRELRNKADVSVFPS
jgi:hypothetical protein